jgi:hypothetical protein
MNEDLAAALGAIALFSFLAVRSWANAQRREREAYYKNEAIKKVAEMQGTPPEPVLALLREALKPSAEAPNPWLVSTGVIREYYRSETLKRITEGVNTEAVLAVMREEERRSARRVREGLKLAGLISAGVGVGLLIFLRVVVPDMPVYLASLIPLLLGAALLAYAFLFWPGDRE